MARPSKHQSPDSQLGDHEVREIASTMRALGTPARLRILFLLLGGEKTVDDLAELAQVEQSAASHHLRLLRDVRLVRVRREGRHAHYSLFDHHVPDLLASVRHHQEHLDGPEPRRPRSPATPARQ